MVLLVCDGIEFSDRTQYDRQLFESRGFVTFLAVPVLEVQEIGGDNKRPDPLRIRPFSAIDAVRDVYLQIDRTRYAAQSPPC